MVVSCEQVWREVSNYIDGEVDPAVRVAIEEHIRGCQRCAAVLTGTRNVVELYGDERMLEVPFGFGQRLHRRLDESMPHPRRSFLGWMATAAAAVLVAGSFEIVRSLHSHSPQPRSELAQRGKGVPPDLKVVAAEEGRLFHVPGCEFIHDKTKLRAMTAAEAERQGYTPCPRCLKQYLVADEGSPPEGVSS
jgi:putative zinc finger protein